MSSRVVDRSTGAESRAADSAGEVAVAGSTTRTFDWWTTPSTRDDDEVFMDYEAVQVFDYETGIAYEVGFVPGADRPGGGWEWVASRFVTMVDPGIDLETAESMPRAQVIALARRFLETGAPSFLRGADRPNGERAHRAPSLQAVAQVWHEAAQLRQRQLNGHREPGERRVSVRQHIADVFEAGSVQTVDAWIRAARDAHLIPAATTGKPRTSTTSRKD